MLITCASHLIRPPKEQSNMCLNRNPGSLPLAENLENGHLWLILDNNRRTFTFGATGSEHNSAATRRGDYQLLLQLQFGLEHLTAEALEIGILLDVAFRDGSLTTGANKCWVLNWG